MKINKSNITKKMLKLGAAALTTVMSINGLTATLPAGAADINTIHDSMISRLQASADALLSSQLYSRYAEKQMESIIKQYSKEIKTATTEKRANYIRSLGYAALKEVEYVRDVAIDAEHFPDAALRSAVASAFDSNKDGVLQKTEAENALELEVSGLGIYELTGIGYLPFLKTLNVSSNNLSLLDLSKNAVLVTVNCSVNNISELNISGLEKLKTLNCSANTIDELNLKGAKKLVTLNCDANPIKTLNLSKNTRLKTLSCCLCNISELDLSSNTALESVICHSNGLTSLEVTKCSELNELLAGSNSLTKLVVTRNKKLQVLDCSNNGLSSLHLRNNQKLVYLNCSGNSLTQLRVPKTVKSLSTDKSTEILY